MAICVLLLAHGVAQAQLNERHSFNARGDVEMIGNALLTCASCDQSNSGLNNGSSMAMRFVNIEGNRLPAGVPQNSSTATLSLPSGARVLSAGLYWGGRSTENNAARGTLQFRTPSGSYQAISASDLNTFPSQGDAGSRPYSAYRDVTALVAAAGAGTYAAGGLTSDVSGNNNGGGLGNYGGWALIVLYEHDSKPYRRLMVFDGDAGYVNGTNPQSVTVTGLLTPQNGEFTAYMGALVWEGDGGITGDQFRLSGADVLNPGALSDAQSPANNFWNSGISRLGERFTAKNPDYVNQFAVDLKLVDISNTAANSGRPRLRNGATGATLEFTSSQDAYFPHALVFATDIFFPDLVTSLTKQARRVPSGEVLGPSSEVRQGEEVEYIVSFTNNGQDGATNVVVTDPIPSNTTYVPGSLRVLTNAADAATGSMSDAVGDDIAEFDTANNRVVFRIGSGATGSVGGMVLPTQSAQMSFRVRVDAAAPTGEPIRNVVSVRHNAQTVPLPQDVEGEADANVIGPVVPAAEEIGFCPVDGGFFNIVNGVGIYQYTPGSAADTRVAGLDFAVTGDLNGLMVDPTGRTRLLFHQGSGGVVWAYDPTHPTSPGWYRTGATINANLPRAGMTQTGVGYLITAATRAGAGATAQMYRIERDGDYGYRLAGQSTLTYDVAPSDFGSGDIAFDDQGVGWLVAGNDLYRVDVDKGTATRQQTFTGAPSGVNYAGAAFGADGLLYVVVNTTGAYYAMDLTNGTMSQVGASASGAGRDLASCSFPTIAPAQLQVTKTLASITRDGQPVAAGESAAPGDLLGYAIEVRHVGGTQAATVFAGDVVETVPANTLHGATADDFTCTGANCVNTQSRNVLAGQSTVFSFVVQIDVGTPATVNQIVNAVTVNGIDCAATGNDCDETTLIAVEPAVTSSKALTAVNGAAPAGPVAVGDVLTYTVTVTNSGNVTLPTVTVADARITPDNITCAPLTVGNTCTLVGTYTVTQADADAGTIRNTATVTTPDTPAVCPAGSTDAVCQPSIEIPTETPDPSLTVVKTASTPSGNTAGSTIAYSFLVTNTGNVTIANIAIDDDKLDAAAVCPVTTLAPGASTTCTGTHTITQAEVDAGEVLNTATATGTTPGGGTTTSPPDEEDVTLETTPSLTVVKTASTPSGNTAGSTIAYSFLVTNTGNVTIGNIAIDDDKLDAAAVCPVTTLAPGASTTCTGTHTITQAEVDAGKVLNTATATGTTPGGGPTTSPPDEEDVTLETTPSLTVVKTASTPSGNTAGSTIAYSFLVTNTGNVTIANIAIDDDKLDAAAVCPVTTLAPGASTTCTGTHTITQAEVDAGKVLNTATATGTTPGGGTTTSPPDEEDVTIERNPGMATNKALAGNADEDGSGTVTLGDTLTYTITATNTGTVSLGNVEVRDDRITPSSLVCASLAPGASCVLTGTYVVTQADVNAGQVVNTAVITTDEPSVCPAGDTSAACQPSVTIDVTPYEIVANDDRYGPVNGATGNPSVGTILDNDTLNGVPATPDTVTITLGTLPTGIVVDPSTGVVGVTPGTPAGSYTFEYTICEVLNPDNCDTATVTVEVEAAEIVANDDSYGPVNGATGDPSVGNLLDNDTLNGVPATIDTVTITVGELRVGVVVDPSTGVVGVAPGTPAGSHTFEYTICEVLNPSNCDTATVTVEVEAAEIVANDDNYGPVNGATGNPSVGNILDNDTLNGVPATPDTVTITVGTLPTGIVVDPSTGVVGVAPGTPAGTYTFEYTICEVLNPDNCDTATVTVEVEAAEIVANDDSYGPVNGATGDPSVGNVLDNDTLNGVPATIDTVTITVGTLPTGIVVDPSTGVVGVAPGTPAGSYTFDYTICEVLNPSNCDTATVTVVVEAAEIVANDDSYGPVNGATGDPSVGNLLDNDTLNGVPATIDTVTITVGTLPTGIVVDPSTGVVGVAPGSPAGSYTFEYTICEVLNPENCDTASVTVVIEAPEITAADDSTTTDQNTPVTIPVLDNDTLNGVPVDADDVTVVELTPPANGSIVIQPDGTVVYTPNPGFSGDDSFEYRICEITNPENCATATVTVMVRPNIVEAIDDDAGTAEPGVPTPVVVVDNDTSTGAPLDPGSVTILTPSQHGQVSCANGTCSYTPAFGYNGEDSFVYRVCDTSYPAPVCDTATVTVKVQGEAPLRVTKSVAVREVKVGDLVRYTLTVENVSNAMVTGAHVLDTPPQGFSYVDGSLSSGDGRALAVSGHNPIRISSLDLAPGDTMSISYLLRVGAGIRAGSHINQAVAQSESGVPLSNIATAQVGTAFDPLLDDSLVFGTVFDDRNGDGWQASAVLTNVRVQGGFAPEVYVAGSTTIDRGDGPQPVADASAPLLHGMALGTITGRQSVGDPIEAHQVVIRQRLRSATFAGDFMLTSAQGVTVRMAADGSTQVEREGEAAKGLSAAEPTVTRRVMQEADGLVVEYVIANSGIDERGIPGVRIASVEGLLIETDQYGRYHLVDVSGGNAMHGRNFILKVDPSTLPPGTEFTTANPLVRRVTPGLPVRFDFGVKLPVIELQGGREAVELELGEVFFARDSSELREAYLPAIEAMAGQIDRYRGGRVIVTGEGEHEALAFARAAVVRDALQSRVAPDAAAALTVELRTRVDDPHAMVAGVGNGGVLLGTVLFDTDKSAIRPEFEALLDAVAQRLEALGGGTVGIVGHTDVRGSHAYNVDLGLRRAQSVFDALSGRLSPQVRAKTRVEASRDPAAPVGEARK
ncbi:Ig-like domain-containing protein [Luteimonas sp. S4-F44]|uniref:DUF7507 domain-containing protein n=1 Tax=Luteimonas sp. S4-F44 TaxID=2925842 RepID=UPI001F5370A9|nr:Ig-like domain-containing protein [Luteimonas sp. S4-F44]UNK42040.1 Ig-like domain-containing protein [Luteimonas sp. S4-F44]